MMISALDSYFFYVTKRLQTLGATVHIAGRDIAQPVGGVVNATDWPEQGVVEGGVYLLIQRVAPGGVSKTQRKYTFYCQWAWLIIGTDLGQGEEGTNRGDRYRADQQIMQNLKEANFPGFCQKMDYSVSTEGVESAVAVGNPRQMVLWDELSFMPRSDTQKSGVQYNGAAVEISCWEDMQSAQGLQLSDTWGPQIVGA